MSITFLLLMLLPPVAFVVVDAFSGYRPGIASAMALALLAFGANWAVMGNLDPSAVVEPIFILLLGFLALRFSNPSLFRFQPVAIDVGMALLLAWYQFFSEPFLQKYFPPLMKAFKAELPPEMVGLFTSPAFHEALGRLSLHLLFLFLLHAALVAWTARGKSNWWWLAARLAIYPMLLAVFLFDTFSLFLQGGA